MKERRIGKEEKKGKGKEKEDNGEVVTEMIVFGVSGSLLVN